jgi:hypothetical protein
MKVLLIVIVLLLVLSSCSLPVSTLPEEPVPQEKHESQLLSIRIERWSSVRFSGLLALQERDAGLYYVLLDATGVKLVETLVSKDGSYNLIHANGPLKDSGLVAFLSEALARVYLFEPRNRPCSRNWLLGFCHQKTGEGQWLKSVKVGPVTIWEALIADLHEDDPLAVYSQPWLGVRILLEKLHHPG